MNDQIKCPNCGKMIPLTQALSHDIQEKYQKFYKQRLQEETAKVEQVLRSELAKKVKAEMDVKLKDKANEAEELQKQNKSLQDQLLETNKLIRQLKTVNEQNRLELEKKLAASEEKIRYEERKRMDEEYHLKDMEKEKKLQDALKVNEELRRKLEQGSQQIQGEVLELELEQMIKKEFPYDEISEVPKGVRGADIIQVVKNQFGKKCGVIIWESKRTKAWSNEWISKLKQDQQQVNAEVAVIVSSVLPDDIRHFGLRQSVWVCSYEAFLGLTLILRDSLIKIASVKLSVVGKESKQEILWNYLTGTEFKSRIDAIYDAYGQLQDDLEKEKRWFSLKWAKQEKNIRRVIDNILGMSGDLQSIVGKALPEIKGVNILPEEKVEVKETLF